MSVLSAVDIAEQRAWSDETFGPGPRAAGVIDHLTKELTEVAADPNDLSEWIDLLILTLDGASRQGFTGEQIIEAYHTKMKENHLRSWPDWRTCDPNKAIEHLRPEIEDGKPVIAVVRNFGAEKTHLARPKATYTAHEFGATYQKPAYDTVALCGVHIKDGVVMQTGTKVRCTVCKHLWGFGL